MLIGVGLAMDAFAVSICKGLTLRDKCAKEGAIAGAYFGGFQAAMPVLGFFVASLFKDAINDYDHWIAFGLLAIIGAGMIKEALKGEEEKTEGGFGAKAMIPLAVATSIDALAVGVSLALLGVNIWLAAAIIGAITFCISAVGIKIGSIFGAKFKAKAEIAGGIILIGIGVKILLEHML